MGNRFGDQHPHRHAMVPAGNFSARPAERGLNNPPMGSFSARPAERGLNNSPTGNFSDAGRA